MKKPLIVIVGPTAVGKTHLSVQLAKKLNGEIINGDAMQVYQGLDILTAKIKKEEMEGVPHHLFSFLPISQDYNVADYQKNIRLKIKEIQNRNKTPIIVGGTGLYIKAALYDYEFKEQKENQHQEIQKKYQDFTNQQLFDYLTQIDAESAKILHPNNRRRVLRAIEIYENTGESKSSLLNQQKHHLLYDCIFIGLTLPVEELNQRINNRVEEMFLQPIIEEVKNLPTQSTASKAIGYQQIQDYLQGKCSLEECKEQIKLKTRQYRKRQMTWLKHQFDVHWFDMRHNPLNVIYNYIKGVCSWNDSSKS